ncbi:MULTISPECIES: hypothetical protein [unclassified Microbacterium]|uniref:FMN-binding protein n=1 Tax=unclassified Microbacterium TaxID=2609290 RepID=UPI003746FC2A
MIRPAVLPRPARVTAAFVGVLGIVTLAGCATDATTTTPSDTSSSDAAPAASSAPDASAAPAAGDATGAYADGTYTGEGTYATPESVETIEVTLTLENDVVTAVEVVGDPQAAESQRYQSQFIGGISDEVVGKSIDDLSVSRVAGSSLTSGGFNQAVDAIKSEAAA